MCVAMMRPMASLSVWRRCTRILAITMESTPTIQGRNGDSKRKYVKRKSSDRDSKGGDRDRKGSDIWALRSSGGREGDRKKGSGDICRNTRWRGVRQKRR
jgi:hypothetical protein